jgi:hypothetical protein
VRQGQGKAKPVVNWKMPMIEVKPVTEELQSHVTVSDPKIEVMENEEPGSQPSSVRLQGEGGIVIGQDGEGNHIELMSEDREMMGEHGIVIGQNGEGNQIELTNEDREMMVEDGILIGQNGEGNQGGSKTIENR